MTCQVACSWRASNWATVFLLVAVIHAVGVFEKSWQRYTCSHVSLMAVASEVQRWHSSFIKIILSITSLSVFFTVFMYSCWRRRGQRPRIFCVVAAGQLRMGWWIQRSFWVVPCGLWGSNAETNHVPVWTGVCKDYFETQAKYIQTKRWTNNMKTSHFF